MRDSAQLLDGFVDLDAETLEHCPLLGSTEPLTRQREVDPQRHQPLLRAVVQVTFDPPPLSAKPSRFGATIERDRASLQVSTAQHWRWRRRPSPSVA
nr:hypothetical protein [Solirubrobacter ginsenosidimutans]